MATTTNDDYKNKTNHSDKNNDDNVDNDNSIDHDHFIQQREICSATSSTFLSLRPSRSSFSATAGTTYHGTSHSPGNCDRDDAVRVAPPRSIPIMSEASKREQHVLC